MAKAKAASSNKTSFGKRTKLSVIDKDIKYLLKGI